MFSDQLTIGIYLKWTVSHGQGLFLTALSGTRCKGLRTCPHSQVLKGSGQFKKKNKTVSLFGIWVIAFVVEFGLGILVIAHCEWCYTPWS